MKTNILKYKLTYTQYHVKKKNNADIFKVILLRKKALKTTYRIY